MPHELLGEHFLIQNIFSDFSNFDRLNSKILFIKSIVCKYGLYP